VLTQEKYIYKGNDMSITKMTSKTLGRFSMSPIALQTWVSSCGHAQCWFHGREWSRPIWQFLSSCWGYLDGHDSVDTDHVLASGFVWGPGCTLAQRVARDISCGFLTEPCTKIQGEWWCGPTKHVVPVGDVGSSYGALAPMPRALVAKEICNFLTTLVVFFGYSIHSWFCFSCGIILANKPPSPLVLPIGENPSQAPSGNTVGSGILGGDLAPVFMYGALLPSRAPISIRNCTNLK
jgi:hypothetical protein